MELGIFLDNSFAIDCNIFDLFIDDILVLVRPGCTHAKASGNQGPNEDEVELHVDAKQLR